VDLAFRLLHQFSDQFSSLEKPVLAFHKNVCLSPCVLLRRMIDDPVAVYDLLEVVLCATAVICSASSGQPSSARLGSFELLFFGLKKKGCHCAGNDSAEILTDRQCATGSSGLFTIAAAPFLSDVPFVAAKHQ
jgi:hypothetical protein